MCRTILGASTRLPSMLIIDDCYMSYHRGMSCQRSWLTRFFTIYALLLNFFLTTYQVNQDIAAPYNKNNLIGIDWSISEQCACIQAGWRNTARLELSSSETHVTTVHTCYAHKHIDDITSNPKSCGTYVDVERIVVNKMFLWKVKSTRIVDSVPPVTLRRHSSHQRYNAAVG